VIVGLSAAGLAACSDKGASPGLRKLGVAVVGLGFVSVKDVLPALKRSDYCRPAALVSSDVGKLQQLGDKYGVPRTAQYTYENFDRIADNPDIDLVYIALPNALHADYTIRAARAGKHVLCEKPMAVTVEQCEAMIAACEQAGKSLAVAYRLHYSPHHQEMIRRLRAGELGQVQLIRANIGFPLGEDAGWRLKRDLAGGGVLLEQGVYPVNSARSLVGEDPVEVLGYESKSDPRRFAEVDETVSWSMRFANGTVAHCAASYTVPAGHVWAGGPLGWIELEQPYSVKKIEARTAEGDIRLGQADQFVLQADTFAKLIQEGKPPGPGISAQDGLRDVRIMNAIYESIRSQRVVRL
jgi:predicted dehydrogenase